MFVNNKIQHFRRFDLENDDIEAIWIEIAFPNARSIILCHGYRPEWVTVRDWSEKIETSLERVLAENKEVIIMGDLNIDWKDIDKSECHPWKELLVGFQLEQMIAEPTRVTDTTSTLIDHIYVSQKECIRATSDHYPTCAVWKLKFSQKQQHAHMKYRSMKNSNEQKFREDLREVPWHVLDIFDNPNDAVSAWSSLFMEIVESHAPLRSRRVKHPKQPDWMTPDIIQAINERDRLKAAGFHNEARILRNEVVGLIKEAKKVYYHTMIENQQKNSKALWSYLTDLTPKEKSQEPIFMSSDGKHVTDSAQISNLS